MPLFLFSDAQNWLSTLPGGDKLFIHVDLPSIFEHNLPNYRYNFEDYNTLSLIQKINTIQNFQPTFYILMLRDVQLLWYYEHHLNNKE